MPELSADMVNDLGPCHSAFYRSAVSQISQGKFDTQLFQSAGATWIAHQCTDRFAFLG
jgi:hypothetical protein